MNKNDKPTPPASPTPTRTQSNQYDLSSKSIPSLPLTPPIAPSRNRFSKASVDSNQDLDAAVEMICFGDNSELKRANWENAKEPRQLDDEQEVQIGDIIGAGAWGVVHRSTLSPKRVSSSSFPIVVAVKIASNMADANKILEKEARILSYINSKTTRD